MICLNCNSKSIIKYGHFRGKQRFICKKCRRTFTEFSNKGYPPTSVHPLFIAYILHRYKDETIIDITRTVNNFLSIFKSHNISVGTKDKVSMSTVYKWIRNYDDFVSNITTTQAIMFFQKKIKKAFPKIKDRELPEPKFKIKEMDLTITGPKSYIEFLKILKFTNNKEVLDNEIKDEDFIKNLYKIFKQKTIKHEYYQEVFK